METQHMFEGTRYSVNPSDKAQHACILLFNLKRYA